MTIMYTSVTDKQFELLIQQSCIYIQCI